MIKSEITTKDWASWRIFAMTPEEESQVVEAVNDY